ncbi:MAG TPA: diguanylate cyclase [Oligoflexia bacterium]|nr:diguanylate cyclase [Oligoflexia bacterium]
MDKARIVIADDDAENVKMLDELVRAEGHLTKTCGDGEAVLHLVRSWSPHLLLLDVDMPKMSGLECAKKVRSQISSDYVGIMMVTAQSDLSTLQNCFDAGADDYLLKPYRSDELRARMKNNLRIRGVHDSLRRMNRKLEEAATIDELTGLRNMRYLSKRLIDEVEHAKKHRVPLSCIMFDMDHFKQVNDQHDHLFGSQVLHEIGQLVMTKLRASDVPARYGGDEFFILLPGTTLKSAVDVAEQLRKLFETHQFKSGTHATRVTASFGVSGTHHPNDFEVLEARELIRSADSAMYSAKNAGRNRVETYAFIK